MPQTLLVWLLVHVNELHGILNAKVLKLGQLILRHSLSNSNTKFHFWLSNWPKTLQGLEAFWLKEEGDLEKEKEEGKKRRRKEEKKEESRE